MIKTKTTLLMSAFLYAAMSLISCGSGTDEKEPKAAEEASSKADIKEDAVNYKVDSLGFNSYVTYDNNMKGKRPAVLVIPEWWGLGDYVRGRAKQLAEMGYVAMAVDMYGNGKTADDPKVAGELATPFYMNPQLTKVRIDAAIDRLKGYEQVDAGNIAAIGYCFGGYSVLNAAKLGADLKGVVSFHGNLSGVSPKKDLLKAKVLVCHGGADSFVPEAEVNAFKKSMDSVGAPYTFKVYPNATHAFTNPNATEKGEKFKMPIKYNPAADTASWNDMKAFFATIFPGSKIDSIQ